MTKVVRNMSGAFTSSEVANDMKSRFILRQDPPCLANQIERPSDEDHILRLSVASYFERFCQRLRHPCVRIVEVLAQCLGPRGTSLIWSCQNDVVGERQ